MNRLFSQHCSLTLDGFLRVLPSYEYLFVGRGDSHQEKKRGNTHMSLRGSDVTISAIKADVGSIGGHTRPSTAMINLAKGAVTGAINDGLLIDGDVTYTGDDTALIMVHQHGENAAQVHTFASETFFAMTEVAKEEGLYGAGQDLLTDAPSGNVRGAGPGAAEIEFTLLPDYRKAESLMIFAADKCGPGLFNPYVRDLLTNPDVNAGLLLSPVLQLGFVVRVVDMNPGESRVAVFNLPEDYLKLAAILRKPDRYAIKSVTSRAHPGEKLMDFTTDRLHNHGGKYIGKDDPLGICRNQGIFPAPEEYVRPWQNPRRTTGGARGSSKQYPFPVAINTAVTGAYCQTLVTCVGYSLNEFGKLSERADFFANPVWDYTRNKVLSLGDQLRMEGFDEGAIASHEELAYTGLSELDSALEGMFEQTV